MVKISSDETQRIKTAFLSYSQGQPKISEQMIDQFICGAIPGLSWEQLQEKKGSGAANGYDRSAFFQLVTSDERYVQFIVANFPCAPPDEKPPEIDVLELKTQKGF
ncbi:hypothetical protein ERJ75_000426600 [Trypanosoma vivax]|uniref:Uncharacterized protein n=1 Tax=Trypanosoma vivax (strain Y486) TaxID=1055687 RepID=G0U1N8_TRYVY|nr:hypothetical protein TRVL_04943 [Trypanosoma vivax]KAH8616930.1 hypothetical protein ERJ75_000426600 [Trypanosoma vivax]CCC49995.1 conserved hypothetical protein [Trypanosoma vivax Y486]